MTRVKFGWLAPAFPGDSSRRSTFVDQITNVLGRIQDRFDSAWIEDHFMPWADFPDPAGVELFAEAVIPQFQ